MDPYPINDVVARVVAWHNRHPLARHITPQEVHNVGVVALPFVEEEPARASRSEPVERNESSPRVAGLDAPRPPGSLRERAAAQNAASGDSLSVFADLPERLAPPRPRPWWERVSLKHLLRPRAARGPGSSPDAGQRFRAVFSEDFIAPLSVAQVARWSADQGQLARPGDVDWPVRDVPVDPSLLSRGRSPAGSPVTLYLPTAAIEVGEQRARVLVGRGRDAEVLGPRIWSPWRVGSAAALTLASLGLGALSVLSVPLTATQVAKAPAAAPPLAPARDVPPPAPARAASAASSASVPSALLAGALPPVSKLVSAAASVPAVATVAEAPSAPRRTPSVDAPALRGSVRPELDSAMKQALKRQSDELRALSLAERGPQPAAAATQAVTAARKEAAPGSGATKVLPAVEATTAVTAATTANARATSRASSVEVMPDDLQDIAKAGVRVYALAAQSTRLQADSEALLIQMRSSAANTPPPKGSRVEVLEVKNGWRAIWWPFVKREDAERAQKALARRGLKAEVIDF